MQREVADLDLNSLTTINVVGLGLASTSFNIKAANTGSTVKSVKFSNGQNESVEPFAYCGDNGGNYNTCADLTDGLHTITVTPFPMGGQQGTPYDDITVTFRINSLGTDAPTISPAPTDAPVPAPTFAPTISKAPTFPNECGIPKLLGNDWEPNSVKYVMPIAEAQGAMIGNDFVLISGFNDGEGGYSDATVLNYARDMTVPNAPWRAVDPLPTGYGITHGAFVVVGSKLYMCGGYQGGHPG